MIIVDHFKGKGEERGERTREKGVRVNKWVSESVYIQTRASLAPLGFHLDE